MAEKKVHTGTGRVRLCKEGFCTNNRQKGSSRCEVHVGIKRKVIPQTHGAD